MGLRKHGSDQVSRVCSDTGHKAHMPGVTTTRARAYYGCAPGILWGKGHTMVGSGVGILKRCIHTLLTLTRGHSTTLRDATLKPRTRSTWSLCSLYSLDALTLTPSSCSTGTACDKFENMCTLPSITTHQCALPSPRRLLIYTPHPYLLCRLPAEVVHLNIWFMCKCAHPRFWMRVRCDASGGGMAASESPVCVSDGSSSASTPPRSHHWSWCSSAS